MTEGLAGGGELVDARGLRCPLPVIELQKAATVAGPGQLLTLLSDDPAAAGDVAAWCGMRGHELVERHPAVGGGTAFVVRTHAADEVKVPETS